MSKVINKNKVQFFPVMSEEEFEALKASIADRGVEVPIIVDQDGDIIDGHQRKRACDELGINCLTEVRNFENENQKLELALTLNCNRRHLNQKQKRTLIEEYLLRDAEIADNHLAGIIGVSKNTVASVRRKLEASCQIDKFEMLRGKDGVKRPKKQNRIIANTPKETEKACQMILQLPEKSSGKTHDVISAQRHAKRNQNAQKRKVEGESVVPVTDEDIRIFHTPFQKLESVAGIEPESVQLICTDVPYDKSFLPQIEELAEFAERVLVDGGVLVTYSGQYWLPQVMGMLGKHLDYRWMIASYWSGDANQINIGNCSITNSWKPILVFSKGKMNKKCVIPDVSHVQTKEKQWHDWQQPLSEAELLIRSFSSSGDLVVDPCSGGFTTAVASRNLNRRFIGCDIDEECVQNGHRRLQLTKSLTEYVEDAVELGRSDINEMLQDWSEINAVSPALASGLVLELSESIKESVNSEPMIAV
ncbi:DNA methyltransferase [Gimesia panareensis]|uniref:DNA methyltransferase n=1 Tax=Gimesia panareensis TaxID=2527978 RepID=UPI001187FB8E|nr:DNA methyltransferase [Gimesia panareensis]QDU50511.1 DNA adenine methyltransferase YhdJ [Gimesia panareensis]